MRYLGLAKGVKCLADVRADGHISQMLDSEVYKVVREKMKEGSRERSAEVAKKQYKRSNTYRYETILPISTSNCLAAVARQTMSGLFVPAAEPVAFSLQMESRVRTEAEPTSSRRSWLSF